MSQCPLCFKELDPGRRLWAVKNVGGTRTVDPDASRVFGRDVSFEAQLPITRADVPGPWPPRVADLFRAFNVPPGAEVEDELCPECHYPLPDGWRDAHVTTVAMCGARASGKSLYIATAVKALNAYLGRMRGSLQMATPETAEIYRERYERPLFEEMGLMEPTVRAEAGQAYQLHPLIFSLGTFQGQARYLVLRDVAGEELENPPAHDGHLEFLPRAHAVIFMFDPLSVEAIRRRLQDLVPTQSRSSGSPVTVLDNLQMRIGTSPRPPGLAVTLSKFDVLQRLRDVQDADWSRVMSNAGAAFMREPSGTTADPQTRMAQLEEDRSLVFLETRSLLLFMESSELVSKIENPHTGRPLPHSYFAVSALGDSPQGDRVSRHGISPHRVIDPLLWALRMNGVVL
ncbi:hypothetical protein GSY69_13280 [Brevibacterium sp. 5221]|uniref:Double-GTPase 2 domain-containing protein n=1 Tax=Brevibacterium rongguiense TaxID=2695267 RepID=A0A6N9HA88_9MICO|nr:hypothetical protein [Brevibacterium rongguiense]MYM20905.1 hypothetical protein [Brevibacterium rongguiense]